MHGVDQLLQLDEALSSLRTCLLVFQELAEELPVFLFAFLGIGKISYEMIDNDRKLALVTVSTSHGTLNVGRMCGHVSCIYCLFQLMSGHQISLWVASGYTTT